MSAGGVNAKPHRVGQHGGEQCGFAGGQLCRRLAEVLPAGGFHAVDVGAELGHVQIHFQNPFLGPEQLDQHREPGFNALAHQGLPGPQVQVLRHLLTDGAGAPDAPVRAVVGDGLADGIKVEAPVVREPLVLGGDHRQRSVR